LQERRVEAEVDSAGLLAEGDPPSDGLVSILREWGVDIGGHVSHRLTGEAVESADLVVTMEHYQVAEVVLVAREAWARTFTLREIVQRAAEIGPRGPDEAFGAWLARVGAGRRRTELVGAWHLDIADPIGQGAFGIDRAADEIDALVNRFVDLAWPKARGGRRARKR
jgi:protein-tyrosine-phosphatase